MSKSRSKGCIYGTPICIKGGGGSRTIGIPDPLGPTRGAQQRAVPEPRSGEGCTPPAQRAVTFMQHCIHNATVYRSRPPAREAGPKNHQPRSGAQPMREHAHNLCASMRTTYACTTQARLRQYVALTYRVPLISIRGSLMNIYLTIDLTIVMG
jgi:hypothetical protein